MSGSPFELWRVVERRPGLWFCEAMPLQWSGRFDGSPVRLVGGLDEALGLALHLCGQAGGCSVTVWPMSGAVRLVEVSGVVPDPVRGGLPAEVVS